MGMDPMQSMPKMSLPPVEDTGGQQSQPMLASQPMQPAGAPAPANGANGAAGNHTNAPAMADDVDLIEKEWIAQIKQIIQNTNNDPYERARQLTLLKSEYLQKRYNKSINIT